MSKFYAKQLPAENFDYENYYNEDIAIESKAWFGGNNRDYCDMNPKLRKDIEEALDNIYSELGGDYTAIDLVDMYMCDSDKLTDEEKAQIVSCAEHWYEGNYDEQSSCICKVLELIHKEPFIFGVIRGYQQSDWLYYICPESMKEDLYWIEAVLFATGTEFLVTDIAVDSREQAEELYDIGEATFLYTPKWRKEEVKKEIADSLFKDVSLEEIALLLIKNERRIIEYDYEEL